MKQKLLEDKIVVVTGASRGFGRALAMRFVCEGAHVTLAARDADVLRTTADEVRQQRINPRQQILEVAADVGRPADVERLMAVALDGVGRIDARAREQLDESRAARAGLRSVERGTDDWRSLRKRAVHLDYFTIYRTLANPAYLDLSIEPDDRPLGSLFAFPDPFDANYGWGGLARTMTSRGWLSTWCGAVTMTPNSFCGAAGANQREDVCR